MDDWIFIETIHRNNIIATLKMIQSQGLQVKGQSQIGSFHEKNLFDYKSRTGDWIQSDQMYEKD